MSSAAVSELRESLRALLSPLPEGDAAVNSANLGAELRRRLAAVESARGDTSFQEAFDGLVAEIFSMHAGKFEALRSKVNSSQTPRQILAALGSPDEVDVSELLERCWEVWGGEPGKKKKSSGAVSKKKKKKPGRKADATISLPKSTAAPKKPPRPLPPGVKTDKEDALWSFLSERGARSKAVIGFGVGNERGLFASVDLSKDEEVAFVPSALVLDENTAPKAVLGALDEALARGGPAQPGSDEAQVRSVYRRMLALVLGLLHERHNPSETFRLYMDALPRSPPPVMAYWSRAQRKCAQAMGVNDASTYMSLIQLAKLAASTVLPDAKGQEVEDAFWLVLTRMTLDFANAAFPGDANAVLKSDSSGHRMVAIRNVSRGDELVIAYNKDDAVSMFASYGCSLGIERSVCMTTIDVGALLPLASRLGLAPIRVSRDARLSDNARMIIRFSALGSEEEMKRAAQAGYFKEAGGVNIGELSENASADVHKWRELEVAAWRLVLDCTRAKLAAWEREVGPTVAALSEDDGVVAKMLRVQHDTELRMLRKFCGALSSEFDAAKSRHGQ